MSAMSPEMDPQTALEVERMETSAWRNEALRSREEIKDLRQALSDYGSWMAGYRRWWESRDA